MACRPLPNQPLPAPLCGLDGVAANATAEDIFTWDSITQRAPRILDAVLETLPGEVKSVLGVVDGIRQLQEEMREGKPLRLLESAHSWVNAPEWNEHLALYVGETWTWHSAPWWLVENYMYKRLLEVIALAGPESMRLDPFRSQKNKASEVAVAAFDASVRPVLEMIAEAESSRPGEAVRHAALEMAIVRSLWGNQADLSLSGGKVEVVGDCGEMITDHLQIAIALLTTVRQRSVVLVLDNHGLEVMCDLVLVDALLRLTDIACVSLHVKDAPVFVSDVTADDMPGILTWLNDRDAGLGARLQSYLADGKLLVAPSSFYTSAYAFWELPDALREEFAQAGAVILKGDANYRRMLGDRHWPYYTDFEAYVQSFWPCKGLISLRTMKSGVAIGIPAAKQAEARAARPNDWLTSGHFGQILASWHCD